MCGFLCSSKKSTHLGSCRCCGLLYLLCDAHCTIFMHIANTPAGPPGSGKTWVGARAVQLIHKALEEARRVAHPSVSCMVAHTGKMAPLGGLNGLEISVRSDHAG